MTQRDAVDVEASELVAEIRHAVECANPDVWPTDQGTALTIHESAVLALRSASNSGAEAMRRAARDQCTEHANYKYALADQEMARGRREQASSDLAEGNAASMLSREMLALPLPFPLPAPGAPASPWRDIQSAPKDGTEFVAWQDGDVYRCQWRSEDDGEGRLDEGWWDFVNSSFEAPSLWTDLPTPPASKDT